MNLTNKTNRREMMNMKYINAYEEFEALGGHEEGGWYYTKRELFYSLFVNDFEDVQERKQALEEALEMQGFDDMIVLVEDTEGESVTTVPQWS